MLVSQEEPQVECFVRNDEGSWTLVEAVGMDALLPLPGLGIELALRELYDKVDFSEPTAPDSAAVGGVA